MDHESASSDDYLIRLFAWVGLGICVIHSLFTAYLVLQRVPAFKSVFDDFDTTLPTVTSIVLRVHWLPILLPVLGVVLGALALVGKRRWMLSACWAAVVLSFGMIMFIWYAIDLPMYTLTRSLTTG